MVEKLEIIICYTIIMALRIFMVGGGSGGHAYPLIAVAQELRKQTEERSIDLELVLMGDSNGQFLKAAAGELGVPYIGILSGKLRRYFSVGNLLDAIKVPIGFIQSILYLWTYMPDVVFSKGGYDSWPVALAARFLFIPVIIHESDSIPGLANKWASKFAKKVFISFENASQYFAEGTAELVGNPIRKEILNGSREEALRYFNLSGEKPTVLFLGGSLGAKTINEAVLLSVAQVSLKYHIIDQCGRANYDEVGRRVAGILKDGQGTYGDDIEKNYRLYPFLSLKEMGLAYAIADLVISRAGAGTISEIAATGKPAIIIPLKESASNHQLMNASEFAKYGAIMLEEDNMTTNILLSEIASALARKSEISEQVANFSKPEAASKIAGYLIEIAK